MEKRSEWVRCPICKNKTRTKLYEDTELRNFPLYCPKCRQETLIDAKGPYTDLQELDAAVLRAFIDRIEVSHVDKKSRTREITIVYNFIGAFDFTRAIENARNTSKKEQRTA